MPVGVHLKPTTTSLKMTMAGKAMRKQTENDSRLIYLSFKSLEPGVCLESIELHRQGQKGQHSSNLFHVKLCLFNSFHDDKEKVHLSAIADIGSG